MVKEIELKRGMRGVYQHCEETHLHRYVAEFDFRYNNRVALGVGAQIAQQTHFAVSLGNVLHITQLTGYEK